MRLLPAFRGTEPRELDTTKAVPLNINPAGGGRPGMPYRTEWSTDRAVREGMQRITWVYRAVHVRATKSAGLPIVVRKGNPRTGEIVDEHPLLSLLNAYSTPNAVPPESAWIFRYRLSAVVDLCPQGAFVEVIRGQGTGEPVALQLLPPGYTWPIIGTAPGRFLDGYLVKIESQEWRLRPEDVVWVGYPHPTNPYARMTPLQAAGIAVDTEWLAKVYQRNFLRNDGRQGGLLLVAGEMGQDDLDELQSRVDVRSGPANAGRITVVEGTRPGPDGNPSGQVDGVHFVDTAVTPREAAYLEMRKYTKEEIFGAYGVPVSKGTANAADRTFENADAEDLTFWRDEMVDHCTVLDRPFDAVDSDPDTFVDHDFSSIGVLQRDRIERDKHLLEEVNAGVITWDEYREQTGRDAYATGGDVILRPVALYPVAGARAEAPPDEGKSAAFGERVKHGRFEIQAKTIAGLRRSRERKIIAYERQCRKAASRLFGRQERAVLGKLRSTKAREGTRHWEAGNGKVAVTYQKVISADDVFDPRDWDDQALNDIGGIVEDVYTDFGADVLDATAGKTAERKADEVSLERTARMAAFLRERGNKIVGMNDTTYDRLVVTLAEGEAAGETIADLAARVIGVFAEASGSRAETIARTEVIGAANMGAIEGAQQSGVVETKVWLATADERTRETHAEADGQAVALDEAFAVGDDELEAPGDPDGSPEETINCRCTVTFETDQEPVF